MPADNHICLCHIAPGDHKHLRLMPSEQIGELMNHAQPGDTLHKVSDDVRLDIYLLMSTIDRQLEEDNCVRIP